MDTEAACKCSGFTPEFQKENSYIANQPVTVQLSGYTRVYKSLVHVVGVVYFIMMTNHLSDHLDKFLEISFSKF